MNNLGWTVQSDIFEDNTPYGVKQFENIIATLNPDSPRRYAYSSRYDIQCTTCELLVQSG